MPQRTILGLGFAFLASTAATDSYAHPAGAYLDPALCRDLHDDLRHGRTTTSYLYQHEDRHEHAVTYCPASAWVYPSTASVYVTAVPTRTVYRRIYVAPRPRVSRRRRVRRAGVYVHIH